MKAVDSVITPKSVVIVLKKTRGPITRRRMVAGSWKQILDTVKMKMATLKRLPVRDRSVGMLVTEAEERMPLSRRLREQRMPAMVQRRRSTLRRSCASSSAVGWGELFERLVVAFSLPVFWAEASCGGVASGVTSEAVEAPSAFAFAILRRVERLLSSCLHVQRKCRNASR